MRQFYEAYRDDEIVSPLVTQLPWAHHLIILGPDVAESDEQGAVAAVAGPASTTSDQRLSAPKLRLLVVTVSNLERSRAFYAALGLELNEERHGSGSLHYSALLEDTVFEFYPSRPGQALATSLRIGLSCDVETWRQFLDASLSAEGVRSLRTSPTAHTYLVRDPDGNAIEVEVIRSREGDLSDA